MDERQICAVASLFALEGELTTSVPYGSGHINDTYKVTIGEIPYTFQRINENVFRNVDGLMENFDRVTRHLSKKLGSIPGRDPQRETLSLVYSKTGERYARDADGNPWRVYHFVDGAQTVDQVESERQAFEAARTFGEFQQLLMDLPGKPLVDTIPDFHHTPSRFAKLETAIKAASPERLELAAAEIEFALERGENCSLVVAGLEDGSIPWRVTHNDTKINNVLLDNASGNGLCVIDLDTVMPGSALYDFGDQVRTTTGTGAEDEEDLSKVNFQIEMFEALVRGYLSVGRNFLTDREIELLDFAGRLITFEIGIRFLTDFLEGDVYFKTHRENHNLIRARTQFEMVRQMESLEAEMKAIVVKHC